jgi:ribosomal protein S18 acetylase RimI-like enzyme
MNVQIRPFEVADAEHVLRLWHNAGIGRPWLDLRHEIAEIRAHDAGLFFVAEDRGNIIGCVMGAYDGRRGWIYHLAVESSLQRRRIGSALMEKVENAMRERGIAKVNLQVRHDNQRVVEFYASLGYVDEELRSFGKWLVNLAPPYEH